MHIGLLAGEASGDILGADLIHALRQLNPDITFSGIGGPLMKAAGCHSLFDMERLSVMGFIDPLKRLPELIKIRKIVLKHFLKNRPDVFIGIDSPDFNLGLELKLKQAGIKVVHYVSPSVWAWRQKRIFKIAKATHLVLTLFPFESDFYKKFNVPAKFVGHPLADNILLENDKAVARKKLGLNKDISYIALLPGSRTNEINYLGKLFAEAALLCKQSNNKIEFITSTINAKRAAEFKTICQQKAPDLKIHFFANQSHDVMAAADVILVASGTATLEALLIKRPMVIAYRMANWIFKIVRPMMKISYIGLPNLLANQSLVPEFIQSDATAENLANALLDFLNDSDKIQKLEEQFIQIHKQLKCNASEQAAKAVMEVTSREL